MLEMNENRSLETINHASVRKMNRTLKIHRKNACDTRGAAPRALINGMYVNIMFTRCSTPVVEQSPDARWVPKNMQER